MAERKWTSWQGEDLTPEYDFTEPSSTVHIVWDEIEVGGRAWKGESDVGSIPVRDEQGVTGQAAGLLAGLSSVSLAAHNRWRWTERYGSNTMARGWIGPKDYRRDRRNEPWRPDRHREVSMSVLDANAQLQGIIVDANRTSETDVARVQWLLSTYLQGSPRATTNLASTYLATGSNTVTLPAQHVFGDPRSVLEEIANIANKQFFVTSDEQLFYDGNDSTAYVAGLRISDRLDEQDVESGGTPDVVGWTHHLQSPNPSVETGFNVPTTNQLLLYFFGRNANDGTITVEWRPDKNNSALDQPMTLLHAWFDQVGFEFSLYGKWNPTPSIDQSAIYEAQTGGGSADRATHGVILVDGFGSDPTANFTYAANSGVGTSGTSSVTAASGALVLSGIYVNNESTSVNATGSGQILLEWEGAQQWMGAISEQPGAGGSTTSGYSYSGTSHGNQWQIGQVVLGVGQPTFPPIWDVGPAATEDGQQLLSGLRMYYGQGTSSYVYVNDPVTASEYSHFEEALTAPDTVTTAAAATTLATAVLQRRKFEERNINVSIGPLTPEQAILVKYGQLIDIKARAIAFADDNFFTGRIRQLRWTTPVPGLFFAHMQIDHPVKDVPYGVGNRSGSTAIDTHLGQGSNSHPEFVPRALLTTQGDLPYRGASDWTRLAIGGSNTWLKSQGNSPIWETLPAAAGTITVKEVDGTPNVSGVSTVRVSNGTLTDDGGGQVTVTTGGGSGGNVSTLPSGAITIGSLELPDRPPTSPGTYNEEFDGTADTLPTDWAWTSAPSGSDEWKLNSRWPSLLTVEGTGNTLYTLTRTSFTAAATFGIWAKIIAGPAAAADKASIRMYVKNSGSTEGRAMEMRPSGADAPSARALKTVASVESVVGAAKALDPGTGTLYVGMTRDGSNNFSHWYSLDGMAWTRITTAEAHTFTIDRFQFLINVHSYQTFCAVDWVRYRTDNAFPRP